MKIAWILILISVSLLSGCLSQSPRQVSKKEKKESANLKAQKRTCKSVSFHKNFFKHQNLVNLFGCLGWSQEYPRITNFLSNIEGRRFDAFSEKFNRKYFTSRKHEVNYFKNLKRLNNKSFWLNTQKFLEASLDNKKIDLILNLIEQSDNKAEFFKLGFLKGLKQVYALKSRIGNTEDFKEHAEFFLGASNDLVTGILQDVVDNLAIPNSRKKIKKFLKSGDWPEAYIHSISADDVINLHDITEGNYEQIANSISTVSHFAESPNYCIAGEAYVIVNHRSELYELGLKFMSTSSKNLLYDIAEIVEKFGLFKNICKRTASHELYLASAEKVLKKSIDVILLPGGLEFFKKILEIQLNDTEESVLDFLNLFSSNFLRNYEELYKSLRESGEVDIYRKLLRVMKKLGSPDLEMNKDAVDSLGILLERNPSFKKYFRTHVQEIAHEFLPDLLLNDIDFTGYLTPFFELMDFMPESEEDYFFIAYFFEELLNNLKDEHFKSEFLDFISEKSLFKFMSILGESKIRNEVLPVDSLDPVLNLSTKNFSRDCVEKIRSLETIEFQNLVESGIYECASEDNNYFVYNIYHWTAQIDKQFLERFDHKFSLNYGVVSPKMMGLYLNLILTLNEYLYEPDSNYIRETIDKIIDVMAGENFFAIATSSLETFDFANKKLKLNRAMLDTITEFLEQDKVDNSKIRKLLGTILSPSVEEEDDVDEICNLLNPKISDHTCITKNTFVNVVGKVSSLAISKNSQGRSVLSNLMDMIYTDKFEIPLFNKESKPYNLTLNEIFDFMSVANSSSTQKKVLYHNKQMKIEPLSLNLSQRLEVLIRDISFNENFYGVHFFNVASKAYNYRSEMIKMRKLLKMMSGSSGAFRFLRLLRADSRWKFKNVWNAYQALLDIEGPFVAEPKSNRNYSKFIQSLLGLTVHASEGHEANFHPYRRPNTYFSKNHKGHLITFLAEQSVISRFGLLLARQESFATDKRFERLKRFWDEFVKRVDRKNSQKFLADLLGHKNLTIIASDFYSLLEKTTAKESKYLVEILALFLEDYIYKSKDPNKFFTVATIFIDHYIDIKTNFKKILDLESVINVKKIRDILKEDWTRDFIISFLDRVIVNESAIKNMVKDRQFAKDVSNNIYFIFNSEIDFETVTLKNIVLHKRNDWMTLLKTSHEINKSKLGVKYFDNMIELLVEKNDRGITKFEEALRAVFEKPDAVEIFLRDIFGKVQFYQ